MGLFDIFRKRKKVSKDEVRGQNIKNNDIENNVGTENSSDVGGVPFYSHTTKIENSNEEIYINNIKYMWSSTNAQGQSFDVYVAMAQKCMQDVARNLESQDYICFEIEKDHSLDSELMDNVAYYYVQEMLQNQEAGRYYLGKIIGKENEYEQKGKSTSVGKWFSGYTDSDKDLTDAQIFRYQNLSEGYQAPVRTQNLQENQSGKDSKSTLDGISH